MKRLMRCAIALAMLVVAANVTRAVEWSVFEVQVDDATLRDVLRSLPSGRNPPTEPRVAPDRRWYSS
ncbi:MAG: hypothetical protein ACOC0O_06195 [Spirochaetota bacterium]